MKRITKILVAVCVAVLGLSTFVLIGCGESKPVIGIMKYGDHQSLNNCRDGMIEGLKQGLGERYNDYRIVEKNDTFDSSVSMANANALAAMNPAVIGAIATPTAMAATTAVGGRLPVVFCAVSDPYAPEVGLDRHSNVTGTADMLDFDGQLDLIVRFIPDVKRIGVLRCTQEQNSASQLASLSEKAKERGIEIVSIAVNNSSELPAAITTLLNKDIDCITNLNDNTVVGALDIIIAEAARKNIPVFGSEIEQVKKGCIASASLDYVELGRVTGLMMADILLGNKNIEDMDIEQIADSFLCYNSKVMSALGLTADVTGLEDVAE